MKKRILSMLLALVMLFSMLPSIGIVAEGHNDDDCITFTSTSSFTLKTNDGAKHWNGTLYWSTDKSTWSVWNGSLITAAQTGGTGDYRLCLYGTTANTSFTKNDAVDHDHVWTLDGSAIVCTGNIETLRGAVGNAPSTTPMAEYCYTRLFTGCESLTTAPDLPATTLSDRCYWGMFSKCSSLTAAPDLPATDLKEGCYYRMFQCCTSLIAAPDLPATTLKQTCYLGMFGGCTNLMFLPELPATTLDEFCYDSMFRDCTSLTYLPELPVTALTEYCYNSMFAGCTGIKLCNEDKGFGSWSGIPADAIPVKDSLRSMFSDTGGDFKGVPEVGKTYYYMEPVGLIFRSDAAFTVTPDGSWDGNLYWSTDNIHWSVVTPETSIASSEGEDAMLIFMGKNNTVITGGNTPWTLTPAEGHTISAEGDLAALLKIKPLQYMTEDEFEDAQYDFRSQYEQRYYLYLADVFGLMSEDDFDWDFDLSEQYDDYEAYVWDCVNNCVNNYIPTPGDNAFAYMFCGQTSLVSLPGCSVKKLSANCYAHTFEGCTGIRLGTTDQSLGSWSIPTDTVIGTDSFKDMIKGTGGSYQGDPTVGMTYYYEPEPCASITSGSTTSYFATVQEAVDTATAGQTVKMLKDSTENIEVKDDDEITLDLNGFVLMGDGSDSVITNKGVLTIEDSNPTKEHKVDTADSLWMPVSDTATGDTVMTVKGGIITGGTGALEKSVDEEEIVVGGGIFNCGTMTVNHINVIGNSAEYGGGIFNGDTLSLNECRIAGNVAEKEGGGIYNDGDRRLSVIGGSIEKNTAEYGGGVMVPWEYLLCFVEDTEITMADGTTKPIQEVREGDFVKSFNHETGKYEAKQVYLTYSGNTASPYFTLSFDDGTELGIAGCHSLFEKESKQYVTVSDENYGDFIGKYFYNAASGTWAELLEVNPENEDKNYYSIYVSQTQNCIANGMLTVPDDTTVFFGMYQFNDDLTVNQEALQSDIDRYGLCKFEDCPLVDTIDLFSALNLKYSNILMAKGILTEKRAKEIYNFWHEISPVVLGGELKIKDNSVGNLCLVDGVTASVDAENPLQGNAEIYVTLGKTEGGSTLSGIVTGPNSIDYKSFFRIEESDFDIYNSGKGLHNHVYIGNPAAQINETGYLYETVQDAIDDAGTVSVTVKLLKDSTENVTVWQYQDITLDLNGFVLESENKDVVIMNNGTLTIKDSNTENLSHFFTVGAKGLWELTENAESFDYTFDAEGLKKDGTAVTEIPGEGKIIKVTGGCITGANTFYDSENPYGGVYSNGNLTVEGGNIVGNDAFKGGGVYNEENGTFTMNGGCIVGNKTKQMGGGVYNKENGAFTMNGGCIGYDYGAVGGGVYNEGTFTMDGGNIAYNDSAEGCVYIGTTGIFTMNNGKITGNSSREHNGYGGYAGGVDNKGTFIMKGGEISANKAVFGGGVYSASVFVMEGGTIKDNIAMSDFATAEGATVTDWYHGIGGGVYIAGGSVTVGGTAEIIGNQNVCRIISGWDAENFKYIITVTGSHTENLYLTSGTLAAVGTGANDAAVPVSGMKVGVTLESGSGDFTDNGTEADKQYFTSDNPIWKVKFVAADGTEGEQDYVPAHLELANFDLTEVADNTVGATLENDAMTLAQAKAIAEAKMPYTGLNKTTVIVYAKGETYADDGKYLTVTADSGNDWKIGTDMTLAGLKALADTDVLVIGITNNHTWRYAEGGAGKKDTLIAYCDVTTSYGTAISLAETQTLTIYAPTLTVSGGAGSAEATLSRTTLGEFDSLTVKYEGTGTTVYSSSIAPTDAGSYKASVTVTKGMASYTAVVSYTIARVTVTINSDEKVNLHTLKIINASATVTGMPAGAKLEWSATVNGKKACVSLSGDSLNCKITSLIPGKLVIKARLVDAKGNPVMSGGEEITATKTVIVDNFIVSAIKTIKGWFK